MDTATLEQKKLFESRPQPEVMKKKMTALKKKTIEQTLAVLNSEQRSQWAKMTGAPFKGQILPPPKGFPPPMPAPPPAAVPDDLSVREIRIRLP